MRSALVPSAATLRAARSCPPNARAATRRSILAAAAPSAPRRRASPAEDHRPGNRGAPRGCSASCHQVAPGWRPRPRYAGGPKAAAACAPATILCAATTAEVTRTCVSCERPAGAPRVSSSRPSSPSSGVPAAQVSRAWEGWWGSGGGAECLDGEMP